jgi:hypothetical protein
MQVCAPEASLVIFCTILLISRILYSWRFFHLNESLSNYFSYLKFVSLAFLGPFAGKLLFAVAVFDLWNRSGDEPR